MIILSSVVVLGLMLMLLSAQYFKQDNLDTLEKKANQVSLILENNYAANNRQYIDFQTGKNALNIFSAASEADFFLVDPSGRTLLCTDTGSCRHSTYIIDSATMAKAKGEGYRGVTTLGSIYEHPSYVVGVPIRSEGVVIGSVFAGADAVGMSTACEAIAARHAQIRVCGISCISNMACGITGEELSHLDVQAVADKRAEEFERLVTRIIEKL